MQKITPFLWFKDQAEEAARFYTSVFKDSRIVSVARYGEAVAEVAGMPLGSTMLVEFEIQGQRFTALNGGPEFSFTMAISFVVNCETQEEVDYFWDKLSEGGETNQCGWLTDKFGVAWQITPIALEEMLREGDPAKTERAMKAMLQMEKLDIATLKQAYEGP